MAEKTWTDEEVNKAIENATKPYQEMIKTLTRVLYLFAIMAIMATGIILFKTL